MLVPTAALVLAGLGVGLVPGLESHLEHAAEFFQDRHSYVETVLNGQLEHPAPGTSALLKLPAASVAWSLVSLAGAVAFALLALYRDQLVPRRVRERSHDLVGGGLNALRAVHSGVIGDYVAWLTFGVAAFGGLLALVLT
jgi:multicomponent Na+:H+ antiporter subunit D